MSVLGERWGRYVGLLLLAAVVGVLSGIASAAFLHALGWATATQREQPWLLFLLPLAGVGMAASYAAWGGAAGRGHNAILDEIHDDLPGTPLRMAPMILVATVATHLFGGSAGREGTAVQMGGAFGGAVGRRFRLEREERQLLLMAGIAAGFGSVFGTPLAGALFAVEVLAIGGLRYDALVPCLIAAWVGDEVTRGLAVTHSEWRLIDVPSATPDVVWRVVVAGVAFGAAAALFAGATHFVETWSRRIARKPALRAFLGGALVVAITLALGTRLYNGLGTDLIAAALTDEGVPTLGFLFKIVLTAVTLGVGFKGGEVTPLFAIGASLGWTLSGWLDLPGPYLAALGFVAVFAAAANTPLACIVLGVEIFGGGPALAFGVAVIVAYTVSGHRGIYPAQRIARGKAPWPRPRGAHLAAVRQQRSERSGGAGDEG